MSEAQLWRYVKKNIGHLGHFSRVESHETSSGIPDVDYCIAGVEGHIELKYGKDRGPKIRGSQVKWFRDREKRGGRPWILTELVMNKTSYYLLHRGSAIETLARNHDHEVWFNTSVASWRQGVNWQDLIEYLTIKV
jgi:hypothetical protein